MKKLPSEPRIADGAGLFNSLVVWAREVAKAINYNVDYWLGFSVWRTGTNGTVASITGLGSDAGPADAVLSLTKRGNGTAAINAYRNSAVRWQIALGNSSPESGGNTGSDANISFFNDAGASLGSINIARATGRIDFPHDVVSARSSQAAATHGFQTNGSFADGSNYATSVMLTNPNWDAIAYQGYHVPGSWAGVRWIVGSISPAVFEMRNNGTGYSVGGWVATSDGRVKINRAPLGDVLSWIDQVEPCEYDRTDCINLDGSAVHRAGFIADQFEPHAPTLVMRDKATEGNPDPIRSFDYDGATAYLWRAVQQLKEENAALRARVETLEGK